MMRYNTQIRLSQFITSYGVGSIIEIPDIGSCIVLSFELSGLFKGGKTPNDFLISNFGTSRLSKILPYRKKHSHETTDEDQDKIGIFELPSNASYGRKSDLDIIYELKKFPNWSLCESTLHSQHGILHQRWKGCPICSFQKEPNELRSEADRNAIRFVSICQDGHINDVDWWYHIHKNTDANCETEYYFWKPVGAGDVKIVCPICHKSCFLKDVIMYGDFCKGHFPEEFILLNKKIISKLKREDNIVDCGNNTQVIPRNSTSVYVPEVITAISTPLEANEFYKILNYGPVAKLLKKHSNEDPPKKSPDFAEIKKILEKEMQKIEEKTKEIDNWIKESPDDEDQLRLEKTKTRYELEVSKINRYLVIIKDRGQFADEVDKINKLIKDFYEMFLLSKEGLTEEEFRAEELRVFLNDSKYLNYPDVNRTLIIEFENKISAEYKKLDILKLNFEIIPVSKLEVIMVQQGYKRICYFEEKSKPKVVSTPYIKKIPNSNDYGNWYPGVRLSGEGVFITLKTELSDLNFGENYEKWLKLFELLKYYNIIMKLEEKQSHEDEESKEEVKKKTKEKLSVKVFKKAFEKMGSVDFLDNITEADYSSMISWLERFRFRKMEGLFIHPAGIWWHTFSHCLIKAISADCGYTLASIRERIYINIEENEIKVGLLLYSARPGMDGTIGGLVYQVPRFEKVIKKALDTIESCSNDPICGTNTLKPGEANGAACYACLFLPETSCEFGNIGLDRKLLTDSIK